MSGCKFGSRRPMQGRISNIVSRYVGVVLLTLLFSITVVANDSGAARVVDCHMPVSIHRGNAVPIGIGSELQSGDTLAVSQGGSITILFSSGNLQTITGPAELILSSEELQSQGTIGKLASGLIGLIFPDKKNAAIARLAVRGQHGAEPPSLTVPILNFPPRESILMDAPDHLEWLTIDGADEYEVTLYDKSRRIWEGHTASASCSLPGDSLNLQSGETYFWVVKAKIGPVFLRSEQSVFGIVDSNSREEILGTVKQIDTLSLDPRVVSLLRVSLYENHGLLLEEYREIESLLKEQPEDYLALLSKAHLCEAMNKYSEATICYRQALQR